MELPFPLSYDLALKHSIAGLQFSIEELYRELANAEEACRSYPTGNVSTGDKARLTDDLKCLADRIQRIQWSLSSSKGLENDLRLLSQQQAVLNNVIQKLTTLEVSEKADKTPEAVQYRCTSFSASAFSRPRYSYSSRAPTINPERATQSVLGRESQSFLTRQSSSYFPQMHNVATNSISCTKSALVELNSATSFESLGLSKETLKMLEGIELSPKEFSKASEIPTKTIN